MCEGVETVTEKVKVKAKNGQTDRGEMFGPWSVLVTGIGIGIDRMI